MQQRVQKLLSQWGIASRRQAERMMAAGRVQLNGEPAQVGQTADPSVDRLVVDGQCLEPDTQPAPCYLLLNKPAGVVATCRDPQQRRTVLDLLPDELRCSCGLHPVGRLDAASTGALLLTNDGALTLRLTHPRYHLPKTYRVRVRGRIGEAALERWRRGLVLDGRPTQPASITVLQRHADTAWLQVTLTEGRNRQIRRSAELLGWRVLALHRTAIGPVPLHPQRGPRLRRGQYRRLARWECQRLQHAAGTVRL
ncbi:MAG: pseudouridine synthase [Cyanobacteria bacterium QS_8_64_29]|jgi:23S rRNA pseudouridine2605 synthase|nr:MAG: pseudouridine synthase [Cyanobacteria bacterium QS_8_64_29]